MAKFYGLLSGNNWKTATTRCGHNTWGVESSVKDYDTRVNCRLYHQDGENRLRLKIGKEFRGDKTIYDGPLAEAAARLSKDDHKNWDNLIGHLRSALIDELGDLGAAVGERVITNLEKYGP